MSTHTLPLTGRIASIMDFLIVSGNLPVDTTWEHLWNVNILNTLAGDDETLVVSTDGDIGFYSELVKGTGNFTGVTTTGVFQDENVIHWGPGVIDRHVTDFVLGDFASETEIEIVIPQCIIGLLAEVGVGLTQNNLIAALDHMYEAGNDPMGDEPLEDEVDIISNSGIYIGSSTVTIHNEELVHNTA